MLCARTRTIILHVSCPARHIEHTSMRRWTWWWPPPVSSILFWGSGRVNAHIFTGAATHITRAKQHHCPCSLSPSLNHIGIYVSHMMCHTHTNIHTYCNAERKSPHRHRANERYVTQQRRSVVVNMFPSWHNKHKHHTHTNTYRMWTLCSACARVWRTYPRDQCARLRRRCVLLETRHVVRYLFGLL